MITITAVYAVNRTMSTAVNAVNSTIGTTVIAVDKTTSTTVNAVDNFMYWRHDCKAQQNIRREQDCQRISINLDKSEAVEHLAGNGGIRDDAGRKGLYVELPTLETP